LLQVIFARAVLADGTLAVASANPADTLPGQPVSAPDLLWALRGGGAGTAVVYEWTVTVYPAPSTVVDCFQEFAVPTLNDYQAFTAQLFSTWDPATTLSGSAYPNMRFNLLKNKSDNHRVAQVWLTGWDVDEETVQTTTTAGMAPLTSSGGGCRTFSSWYEYIVYVAIEGYYGKDAVPTVTPANFTLRYQLSVDFLGWPNGRPVPLTPYGKFDAVNPPGPSAFRAQGIFTYGPWSSSSSTALYNLLDVGVLSGGHVMGGALTNPVGPAALDGVSSTADAAWRGATAMHVIDVSAFNVAGIAAANAAALVLDADPAPVGAGKRFYNFLNCYGLSPHALFDLYYGAAAMRLVGIKTMARAIGKISTWCDI
jgi:hypothetical protein